MRQTEAAAKPLGTLDIRAVLGPGSPLARRLASYEHREGQLAMASAVHHALKTERHLLVEAGTGTGKTLAYLIPAVLSGLKVVVSTATHALEEQIFKRDLPVVREVLATHNVAVRAALMKGLQNYVCRRRLAEQSMTHAHVSADLVRIRRWAATSKTGDRSELADVEEKSSAWRDVSASTETRIGVGCTYHDECFVTRMRREAEDAQIVIVNHHLFFADLALRSGKKGGFGGVIPPYDAVIFDEAHQMESVATEFFGVRVSTARLDALIADTKRALVSEKGIDSVSMRVVDELQAAAEFFFSHWRASADTGLSKVDADLTRRTIGVVDWTEERMAAGTRLDAALGATEALVHRLLGGDDDPVRLLRRIQELRGDLVRIRTTAGVDRVRTAASKERAGQADSLDGSLAVSAASAPASARDRPHDQDSDGFRNGIAWVQARQRSVSLGASPIDVGPLLRRSLFDRVPSVICTSATLATATSVGQSFHFARQRLGVSPEASDLVVPSPFDYAARAALYVAADLPEPSAPGFDIVAAERAAELIAVTGGGAFVLCTSNRAMRALYDGLRTRFSGSLMMQGEAPKHVLLERFSKLGSAVLVATMSFWEGVDVPGRALRLVVIDKIPFAVPSDPVVAARCARIEAEGGNPFTQYSVPSAAIALKQGFGRLIRTTRDAGIVAILDKRAATKGYGRSLLASLPPARRVRTVDDVKAFWQRVDDACDRSGENKFS